MDLSKLTPAPWHASNDECPCVYSDTTSYESPLFEPCESTEADAQFVALARKAFDVQMRRGWGTQKHNGFWIVSVRSVVDMGNLYFSGWLSNHCRDFIDPFTSMVEADKWYSENVEQQRETT